MLADDAAASSEEPACRVDASTAFNSRSCGMAVATQAR